MKNYIKQIGAGVGLVTLGFAGANYHKILGGVTPAPAYEYQVLDWQKPTKDSDWAEDNKKESLNFRTDTELQEMLISHQAKLERLTADYTPMIRYPDSMRADFEKSGMI